MFTLAAGFIRWWTQRPEFNILIVGPDGSGKTTLADVINCHLKQGQIRKTPAQISPTVGLNASKVDCASCRLNLWDLGGRLDLRKLWDNYYTEAHAILFVVDASDPARIPDAITCLRTVASSEETENIPILIIANKTDNPNSLSLHDFAKSLITPETNPYLSRHKTATFLIAANKDPFPDTATLNSIIAWLVNTANENAKTRPPHIPVK